MKAKEVYLFTNRNIIAFDDKGEQISYFQSGVDCYDLDRDIAIEIANNTKKFYIAKWREWRQEISKREFLYLLGLGKEVRRMDEEERKKGGVVES